MRSVLQELTKITTRVLIWVALLLFPLMAFAGGLGIAVLGFAVGVAASLHVVSKPSLRLQLKPYWGAALILSAMIWANITVIWSPYEASGWTNAHTMLLLSVGLIFVPTAYHALKESKIFKLQHVFMATSFVVVGLMLCDVLSGWGLSLFFDPPKGSERLGDRQNDALMNLGHGLFTYVQYSALLIGLFFALFRRALAWAATIAFVLVLGTASKANLLDIGPITLAVMAIVMGVAVWRPIATVKASLFLFALLIVGAPLVGIASDMILQIENLTLPDSYEHRLRMWAYSLEKIQAHPFIGNGFDVARTYQETYISRKGYEITIVSLHPHNIGLHIWLEIGAIGALMITSAIVALFQPALSYATNLPRAMAMAGFLTGTAIIGATTLSAWEFWWWASFALGLLILRLIPDGKPSDASLASPLTK